MCWFEGSFPDRPRSWRTLSTLPMEVIRLVDWWYAIRDVSTEFWCPHWVTTAQPTPHWRWGRRTLASSKLGLAEARRASGSQPSRRWRWRFPRAKNPEWPMLSWWPSFLRPPTQDIPGCPEWLAHPYQQIVVSSGPPPRIIVAPLSGANSSCPLSGTTCAWLHATGRHHTGSMSKSHTDPVWSSPRHVWCILRRVGALAPFHRLHPHCEHSAVAGFSEHVQGGKHQCNRLTSHSDTGWRPLCLVFCCLSRLRVAPSLSAWSFLENILLAAAAAYVGLPAAYLELHAWL